MAEADYPRDGGKEASWIPVCGETEGEVGVGGRGPRQAALPKQDCKQVCVCACVETVPQKGGGSGGGSGGAAASVPFFKQGSLGMHMNDDDGGIAACRNQANITLAFLPPLLLSHLASASTSFSAINCFVRARGCRTLKLLFLRARLHGLELMMNCPRGSAPCKLSVCLCVCVLSVCSCHIQIRMRMCVCVLCDVGSVG